MTRHYTPQERAKHLKSLKSSGLPQAEYCRRNAIKDTTLCGWKKKSKINTQKKSPLVQSRFIPISLKEPKKVKSIEVQLPNLLKITIPCDSPEEFFGLVKGLKEC